MGCRTAVRRKAESAARLASMPTALELLDLVLDAGTWSSWDTPAADPPGIDPAYARALAAARARTGLDESVLTGEGRIGGRRVAAVACEFGFLGGSVGAVAAARLAAALARATAEGLPVLASPASGGTRMQEGTAAFTRLVAVSAAVGRQVAAGLPYLVYLRHPTTGGVFASWGSLGQLSVAEPGALIGYHGPRVSAALTGAEFPAGVQVAENLCAHGLVDAVVPPHGVGAMARRALARFGTAPCVLVGQDRRGPAIDPDGLRAARRGLRLAAELRLPLVSVIDSGGAELSQRAEEGGLAGEIARNVADLVALPTPTVCLLLGQGAGGAALAYLPADRVVAAQHAWLSPLPPEGAAAILHRDAGRAAELAGAQGIRAADLLAAGVADHVVPEHPDAADEPLPFLHRVGSVLEAELAGLARRDPAGLLATRAARYD